MSHVYLPDQSESPSATDPEAINSGSGSALQRMLQAIRGKKGRLHQALGAKGGKPTSRAARGQFEADDKVSANMGEG